MIPPEETRIIIEPEIRGAQAWAERHGIPFTWTRESLEARVILRQIKDGSQFYLRGRFPDYRALPPEWTFSDAAWQHGGRLADFPKPTPTRFGASIFIQFQNPQLSIPNHAVICAPFNRLAYTAGAGPHGNWGGPEHWMEIGKQPTAPGAATEVRAETVGDMLQIIHRDFSCTDGRMGP